MVLKTFEPVEIAGIKAWREVTVVPAVLRRFLRRKSIQGSDGRTESCTFVAHAEGVGHFYACALGSGAEDFSKLPENSKVILFGEFSPNSRRTLFRISSWRQAS